MVHIWHATSPDAVQTDICGFPQCSSCRCRDLKSSTTEILPRWLSFPIRLHVTVEGRQSDVEPYKTQCVVLTFNWLTGCLTMVVMCYRITGRIVVAWGMGRIIMCRAGQLSKRCVVPWEMNASSQTSCTAMTATKTETVSETCASNVSCSQMSAWNIALCCCQSVTVNVANPSYSVVSEVNAKIRETKAVKVPTLPAISHSTPCAGSSRRQ